MPRSARSEMVVAAILGVIVVGLGVVPLARLALEGVAPAGRFGLGTLSAVLAERPTWVAAAHTVESGLAGAAIAVAIGLPAALLVALTDIRGKAALVFAFMLPLLIPPQIV